uniref:NADH-ubiquinone oxidoreductase chain 2 n=1 Tax=Deroceras reticulatum TaxID=145610 RepID=A0A343ERN8_DERRE|nr:NADH dehydrogenase subunit 2 [Deroceras reticulatum]ASL05744.1 NADH dehydrogenase subunit 2 [Deroceras reticulatum]
MSFLIMWFSGFMFLSPIISISATNWLFFWVGMEMGVLSLLPIIYNHGTLLVSESSMKYFLVQSVASILMFFGGVMIFMLLTFGWLSESFMFISLLLKMGLFPLHFWVIPVLSGLWYPQIGLILIPLKVPPLALINYISFNDMIMIIFYLAAVFSMWGGGLLGNNLSNIRGMISASSIAHTGWLIISIYVGKMWCYYLVYSFVLILTLSFIWINNYLMSGLLVLSLSGLPPFIMFSMKYLVVWGLVMDGFSVLSLLVVVLSAVVSLNFYLKSSYSFMLNKKKGGLNVGVMFMTMNLIGGLILLMYI